ncbi:unnamed protein product [Arabis nemorensis]|uniref:DUF4283 domain-containing protein n=1 Tax=Arabis nemorensis TaxID=586526 RepID=A0A565BLW0_9BRAS|nr:unnamed protein product [Arabis nemorensis]
MDQDLWRSLQQLSLDSDQEPLRLQPETINRTEKNNRLSLVVRGLNPRHQIPKHMKNTLPVAWRMERRVQGQVNDDGSVQFFFNEEHHMLTVLEGGPWTFKEWMLVVDKWVNRGQPTYLRKVSFWIRVYNLPNEYRNVQTVRDIGNSLGTAGEIIIREPNGEIPAEIKVRVMMDIDAKLIFTRYVELLEGEEPTLIKFEYERLRKFCRRCGSMRHENTECQEIIVLPMLPIVEFQEHVDVQQQQNDHHSQWQS